MIQAVVSVIARLRRIPLGVTALLVVALKVCQFAVDHTPEFFADSWAFIANALGDFIAFRSYVYGWLIRLVAVPTESLVVLVLCQVLIGAASAWLVAAVLMRHFAVRLPVALACAVVFACDPMQVVHERLVMTETAALFVMAVLVWVYLEYLRSRQLRWLGVAAVAGIVLVALRFVFLPPVLLMAVAVPLAPRRRAASGSAAPWPRSVVAAVLVSGVATLACHTAYRQLTGHLGSSGPQYHDRVGFFQVAAVAPLLRPEDADEPWIADLIATQEAGDIPLSRHSWRVHHLWDAGGFVDRLTKGFAGDARAAERTSARLYRRAVARDPIGFLRLGARTYLGYWSELLHAPLRLRAESGLRSTSFLVPEAAQTLAERFHLDPTALHLLESPARRYYVAAWGWCLVLLTVPILAVLLVRLVPPEHRQGAALLALWNGLVLLSITFGTTETVYRYLHPFSFTGALSFGLLIEAGLCRSRPGRLGG